MLDFCPSRRTAWRRFVRLSLELLEDRSLPSTITINSTADPVSPPAGVVTLRSAIVQAEKDTPPDTIAFAASLNGQTITFNSALPPLTNGETISGPGPASLTIKAAAGGSNPFFNVFTTASTKLAVTISGLTITGGILRSQDGGGVSNTGNLTLSNVVVTGNVAENAPEISSGAFGGGIANLSPGTLTVTGNSVISGNTAAASGGGVYNSGSVTIAQATVANNTAAGDGGGLFNDNINQVGPGSAVGQMTVNAATISGNTAAGSGGGIRNIGVLTVLNSTIVNNQTTGNVGGGIASGSNNSIASTGSLTIEDSTITNNTDGSNSIAIQGGGISFSNAANGPFILDNTIVAKNTTTNGTAPDVNGVVEFGTGDFIGIGDNNLTGIQNGTNGNQIGTQTTPINPLLGPLQNNGGPTQTEAPLPDSPVIDLGVTSAIPTGTTTDQRGALRIVGPAVDVGAVEFQPAAAVSLTASPTTTVFGKTVTLTAAVVPTSPGPNNPITGTVTFLNGASVLGVAPLDANGGATIPFTPPNAGTFTLQATYSGNVGYPAAASPQVALPVGPEPTRIALAVSPQSIVFGQSLTLTATVTVLPDPPLTGTVTFTNGSTPIGTVPVDANGVAVLSFTPQTPGTLTLGASYSGANDFTSSTAAPATAAVERIQTIGVFDPFTATWDLKNSDGPGAPDVPAFQYGGVCWDALVGDWNGTGQDTIAVVDPSTETWYIKFSNSPGAPDITPFQYGGPYWYPLKGDWNGTGQDTIAVVDPTTMTWYIKFSNSPGAPDIKPFQFGPIGSIPVVGDWTGTGHDGIGVFDPKTGTWYLRNTASPGVPDITPFQYGGVGWTPVVGDWAGNGKTTIAVYDPNATWYIKFSNSPGAPDITPFQYGGGEWTPVAGHYLPAAGAALHVDAVGASQAVLDDATLQSVVSAALSRLSAAGAPTDLVQRLASAHYEVAGLPGDELGQTVLGDNLVEISPTAAGRCWFTDASASSDAEYVNGAAQPQTSAATGIDLLTTVLHEMGHLAGRSDIGLTPSGGDLMTDVLGAGQRRVSALDQIFTDF